METITIESKLDCLSQVIEFIESNLEENGISLKIITKLSVVTDEIFSNIAMYSGSSFVTISIEKTDDSIILYFVDDGIAYDPTKKPDPDVTLSAEEREIGGLGIYMVKQMVDEINYSYSDNLNKLTLIKKI